MAADGCGLRRYGGDGRASGATPAVSAAREKPDTDEPNGINGALGELPDDIQRWAAKGRAARVLAILRGETRSRRRRAATGSASPRLRRGKTASCSRPKDDEALNDEPITTLERRIARSSWTSRSSRGLRGSAVLRRSRWTSAAEPAASERQVCRALGVTRRKPRKASSRAIRTAVVEEYVAERLRVLIACHPTAGTGSSRSRAASSITGQNTARPRAQRLVFRAERANELWAMDVTPFHGGQDSWARLAAVIHCHDRELVGFDFARRGRATEARAHHRGDLRRLFRHAATHRAPPAVGSDNGLIF